MLHGPYRYRTPEARTVPAEPGPGPPLLARGAEQAQNGPACAELPPCPATARTHVCIFPYQLSSAGVGREFSCPLEQEPFSHKNYPSLSSARTGAAVSRCLPGLTARPRAAGGNRAGTDQELRLGDPSFATQQRPSRTRAPSVPARLCLAEPPSPAPPSRTGGKG